MRIKVTKKSKYLKQLIGISMIVVFLLLGYAILVNESYQKNKNDFITVMIENHKQKLKGIVGSMVEHITTHTKYIDESINGLFDLMTHSIELIMATDPIKNTSDIKMDYLIQLSDRYPDIILRLFDEASQHLLGSISAGELVVASTEQTLDEVLEGFDSYSVIKFKEKNQLVVVGINKEATYERAKNEILTKVTMSSDFKDQFNIIELNDNQVGKPYAQMIYAPQLEQPYQAITINEASQDFDGRYFLREMIEDINESDGGFNFINWRDKDTPSEIVYSGYYPEFKWIITSGFSQINYEEGNIDEFNNFQKSTTNQIKLAISLACLSFLMALTGGWVSFNFMKSNEIQYERQRNRIITEHNQVLMSKNNQINQIAHDMKNHLISIKGLIAAKQYEPAMTYIDSVYQDIHQLSNQVIMGNRLMDIILNEKISQMQASNIKFEMEIEKVNIDFIDAKDVTIMMNNLLDNAIESCEKCCRKKVKLSIFKFNEGYLVIKLRNSCYREPISIKGKLQTTKALKYQHGYGVQNIIRTVKKYQGEALWEYEKDLKEFSFVITIPIPSESA